MIIDVLVTDQLNLFIVFYETYGQPERCLCPLVVTYMAPEPSVQFFLIGGSFFVIWSARGMGPISYHRSIRIWHSCMHACTHLFPTFFEMMRSLKTLWTHLALGPLTFLMQQSWIQEGYEQRRYNSKSIHYFSLIFIKITTW